MFSIGLVCYFVMFVDCCFVVVVWVCRFFL